MSESNGVIRIPRNGKSRIAWGEDEFFEVDTIGVHDEWYAVDQSMRIDGKIPDTQWVSYNEAKRAFVQDLTSRAYQTQLAGKEIPVLTNAEAAAFISRIQEETVKLRTFFEVKLPGQPESPAHSTVRFSQ